MMANQIDGGSDTRGAVSGIDQERVALQEKMTAKQKRKRPASQDPIDAEMERERLEPGSNTDGSGDVGANPATPSDINSNT